MKITNCLMVCIVCLPLLAGCGDKESDAASSGGPVAAGDKSQTPRHVTESGAGGATPASQAIHLDSATPKEAVGTFLEAVRKGEEETADLMLTETARDEMARAELVAQPPGSPTARYTIDNVELHPQNEKAAYVDTTWADEDSAGHTNKYKITWILRHESGGWRIAGMATKLFDDQQQIVLNFEDPQEMLAKVKEAEQERARRANEAIQQATQPPAPGQTTPKR